MASFVRATLHEDAIITEDRGYHHAYYKMHVVFFGEDDRFMIGFNKITREFWLKDQKTHEVSTPSYRDLRAMGLSAQDILWLLGTEHWWDADKGYSFGCEW